MNRLGSLACAAVYQPKTKPPVREAGRGGSVNPPNRDFSYPLPAFSSCPGFSSGFITASSAAADALRASRSL